MDKVNTSPVPGIPTVSTKIGDQPLAAPTIDSVALHKQNAIPTSVFAVGDVVTDPRTMKVLEIAGIGVRAGIAVYLVRDTDGNESLRNQDEFDEAQASEDGTPIDITPGPTVAP
jgi:hypothetical protein